MKILLLFSSFQLFLISCRCIRPPSHCCSIPSVLRLEGRKGQLWWCFFAIFVSVTMLNTTSSRHVVSAKNVASLFSGGHLVLRRSLPSLLGLWSCSQTAPKVSSSSSSLTSTLPSSSQWPYRGSFYMYISRPFLKSHGCLLQTSMVKWITQPALRGKRYSKDLFQAPKSWARSGKELLPVCLCLRLRCKVGAQH